MNQSKSHQTFRSIGIDHEKLLQKVLQARPWATARDVARMAPSLADVPERELEARMARARRKSLQVR